MTDALQQTIDAAWERRDEIGAEPDPAIRAAVEETIRRLDSGEARVAEKGMDVGDAGNGRFVTHRRADRPVA